MTTTQTDNKKFKRTVAERNAAIRMAKEWLASAEKAINDGLNPARLSDQAYRLACFAFEPGQHLSSFKFSHRSAKRVADDALSHAHWKLSRGEFPSVSQFFSRK